MFDHNHTNGSKSVELIVCPPHIVSMLLCWFVTWEFADSLSVTLCLCVEFADSLSVPYCLRVTLLIISSSQTVCDFSDSLFVTYWLRVTLLILCSSQTVCYFSDSLFVAYSLRVTLLIISASQTVCDFSDSLFVRYWLRVTFLILCSSHTFCVLACMRLCRVSAYVCIVLKGYTWDCTIWCIHSNKHTYIHRQ